MRAAIVGCGNIGSLWDEGDGRLITHASAYQRCSQTTLVAGCDVDEERLARFGRTRAVVGLYRDLDAMLSKERLDVVSLCTPASERVAQLERILSAGVKRVLCEKPIAAGLDEASQIAALARQHGARIAVNYTRRWDEGWCQALNMREQLGEAQAITAHYGKGIVNNGSHMLDLLDMWLGQPTALHVHGRVDDGRDDDPTLHATLDYAGCFAHLVATDHHRYTVFELDMLTTGGRVRMVGDEPIAVYTTRGSKAFSGYTELSEARLIPRTVDRAMLTAVEELVGDDPVRCGVGEATRALRLALQLREQLAPTP